ncbi:MAG: trigger factor [Candidatus Uhrbacteria bacterium]|nr:trigger factor [Patescibacteria group bacterium]MBU1907341.1 trigger factor [Patescibacteria group bacterium]
MSESKLENPTKNTIKLTITVTNEEMRPMLERAAQEISQETKIDGFRPGKADYEAVKQRVGEMKIYEAALEHIVRKTYIEALNSHKLETVGDPKINVEKIAPGNDLVYTVEAALMPKITKLADWQNLKVEAKPTEVEEQDVERALKDLSRMQTKEVRENKDYTSTKADKLVISMNMKQAGVPVEGGQAVDNVVFLAEDHYIPGFCDELCGLKEGDEKTFTLKFPENHYQKNLAGSDIEFETKIKEVYRLEAPPLDETFATSLGQKDVATLKELIKTNIKAEKEREEAMRTERAMLDLVADKSEFDDVPDMLVDEEIHKMEHELQHAIEDQGGKFDDYLNSIKKTREDLKKDFTPEALKRIKVALVVKEIALADKIEVSEAELDSELDKMAEQYQDEEIKKRIFSPQNREYVKVMLRNRKVIDRMRAEMIK